MVSAWAAGSIERSEAAHLGVLSPRARAQYQLSASSMPPPTAPTISAAPARSARPSAASSSASPTAPSASRSARERRGELATSSGTSAAMRQRKPVASTRVIGRMAQVPAARPAQYVFTPAPKGLTAPRPVTSTRLMRRRAAPQ